LANAQHPTRSIRNVPACTLTAGHITASELPLEGAQAARTTYVWLKNLPAGHYELQVRVEQGRGPDLVERRGFEVVNPASGR